MSEGTHYHPSLRNQTQEMDGEHPVLVYESQMPDGSWAKHKVRLSLFPPTGVAFETLEGPLAGSKSFQFYSPKGNETGIAVVGNWISNGAPDEVIRQGVIAFLDTVFKEDQENLLRMG